MLGLAITASLVRLLAELLVSADINPRAPHYETVDQRSL